jgi:hypothetical protein
MSALGELVAYFAPTVGAERGAELVREAARELGWTAETLDDARAEAVLDRLATRAGIVGVTARFAAQRRRARKQDAPAPMTSGAPSATGTKAAPKTLEIDRERIIALMSASMELANARQAVVDEWARARLGGTRCTLDQALALLERLGAIGGTVAVAATFARARILLQR